MTSMSPNAMGQQQQPLPPVQHIHQLPPQCPPMHPQTPSMQQHQSQQMQPPQQLQPHSQAPQQQQQPPQPAPQPTVDKPGEEKAE